MISIESATLIKDAMVAFAATVTATVAIIGLSKWDRELKGKATFEVARALAKATYSLRDGIKNFRSPFIATSEYPEGYGGSLGQASYQEKADALAHLYGNRWKFVRDALQDFDTNTLEAEAIWGEEIRTQTDAFRQCVNDLLAACDAVVEDAKVRGENFNVDPEFGKEMRAKVSTASGSKNALTSAIESAIKDIESVIRPHLKRG